MEGANQKVYNTEIKDFAKRLRKENILNNFTNPVLVRVINTNDNERILRLAKMSNVGVSFTNR